MRSKPSTHSSTSLSIAIRIIFTRILTAIYTASLTTPRYLQRYPQRQSYPHLYHLLNGISTIILNISITILSGVEGPLLNIFIPGTSAQLRSSLDFTQFLFQTQPQPQPQPQPPSPPLSAPTPHVHLSEVSQLRERLSTVESELSQAQRRIQNLEDDLAFRICIPNGVLAKSGTDLAVAVKTNAAYLHTIENLRHSSFILSPFILHPSNMLQISFQYPSTILPLFNGHVFAIHDP